MSPNLMWKNMEKRMRLCFMQVSLVHVVISADIDTTKWRHSQTLVCSGG